MLKDFREKLRPERQNEDVVAQLVREGELDKALKMDRAMTMECVKRADIWESCVYRMAQGCRAGQLLSFMYTHRLSSRVSVESLLRRMYECRDYAGFLKQAERFQVTSGLTAEIEGAITQLETKGQLAQANSYRRALGGLSSS